MPRPINYPISPDAPDSENPDLSVKLKVGPPRMKASKPKGITKSDPQDAGVFTQEKLKRFGGTMKDIPQGMDGAMKKGGKVKKYAEGGDIDADFGAMNEGPAGDDSYTPAPKSRGMEPAAKPKMNMGTAEDFKKSGLTRREYLNKINKLKSRKKEFVGPDDKITNDPMSPAYGAGRVNPKTLLPTMKKGGAVKKYASGGSVSSRADGIAQRGKTRCKTV